MDPTQLNWLSATDAARAVRDGAVSSEELVGACLARVREIDGGMRMPSVPPAQMMPEAKEGS